MIDGDAVAKRLDSRDGFRVISYREVGLPVFRLSCALTLQETTNLGAIEEFTLRAILHGVSDIVGLERFLGLPKKVVATQVGQLVFEGAAMVQPGEPPRYQIAPEGLRRLNAASTAKLVRQRMSIYVDGITRRIIPVDPQDLWTSKSLDQYGVSYVTPTPRRVPKLQDIDLSEVNRVISLMASTTGMPSQRIVRLDAVLGRATMLFRRALAIAFKSADGRRVAIAFAIDGRQSVEHEVEYARSGAAERSTLFATLFDGSKRRREVQAVARELKKDIQIDAGDATAVRPVLRLDRAENPVVPVAIANVRVLSVYEHPPLLRSALETAAKRLLIVSPWIRANVVNDDFMKMLTECLSREVQVTIAYGIGKRDLGEKDQDKQARESLEALARAFPNFRFVRKGNTHAKVLLLDDRFFVTTSFNWLSFRGDPNQPMREEEGTLIADPQAVEAYYRSLLSRIPPDDRIS